MLIGSHLGTTRDRHDPRDHVHEPPARFVRNPPQRVDLRPHMPPVYNQGHLNSCSANAIAAALWFEERYHHRRPRNPSPSRLFIYYNERAIEGVLAHNDPVSLRDGYKTVARDGVCSERMWPYEVHRFQKRPDARCREAAKAHRAVRYARVAQTLGSMRACLAAKRPFAAGFAVHRTFTSRLVRHTGVVPIPTHLDPGLGGHAMLVVGYFEDSRHFIVRNSWGRAWGDGGYCYMPYHYLLDPDLAWDFWTVSKVT
jgi:C1A family cysteine protease